MTASKLSKDGTIDVDNEEMGWDGFDWINLVQDTSCCEHVDELVGFIKCGEEMIASDVGLCSLELNLFWSPT
jgi:hypothetical protein